MNARIAFVFFLFSLLTGCTTLPPDASQVMSLTLAQAVEDSESPDGHRVTGVVSIVAQLTGNQDIDGQLKTLMGLMGGKAGYEYGYNHPVPMSALEVLSLYKAEQPAIPICVIAIELKMLSHDLVKYRVNCVTLEGKIERYIPGTAPDAASEALKSLPPPPRGTKAI
jgi:molecular chaperone DnaK (HSP70)